MSIFKTSTEREAQLSSTFQVTIAAIQRNLLTDWRYKFEFLVQLLWSLTNIVAFGFLGLAVGTGDGEYAPPYTMALFLLSSSAYWTLFTGNYEETALCLREEAARGTMGFLVTNNVNTLGIMVGRFFSSSLKFFIIFCLTSIPCFALVKNEALDPALNLLPHSWSEFFLLLPVFFFAYLFMLALAGIVGSLSLIVKNTTTIVRIVLYLIRILAGHYFALAFFGQFGWWWPKVIVCIPVATGQFALRKYLIEHETGDFLGVPYWEVIMINAIITIVLLVIMYFVVKFNTERARKKGTIEFY